MKNRILSVFLICVLICTMLALTVSAQNRGARLVDNAELLDASEEKAILSRLDEISEKYQYDVVILTEKTIGDKSTTDYADDYYDNNGYGYGDKHSGLLLLITFDDEGGLWWISTCGDAINAFSDSDIESVGSAISSDLVAENYKNAFDTFIDECDYYINGHINGFPFNTGMNLVISIIIGFIIAFIAVSSMKGQLKSVQLQKNAASYIKQGSMQITNSRDFFLYSTINRTAKPKDDDSSTHNSSSGREHGGGGGRF